jgi:hypothetical protein
MIHEGEELTAFFALTQPLEQSPWNNEQFESAAGEIYIQLL